MDRSTGMKKHGQSRHLRRLLIAPVLALLFPPLAAGPAAANELLNLSIEELMYVPVTSASKREEPYVNTAAAIFVISESMIRRSGARSIAEALRLAPGLEVQKLNANLYGIAARGQNDIYSDKLLVMIDGRSVYSPTFSGVWWQTINYPLEDIERIEVLRGASGAVWGANAVNGVINIITKSALKTEGILFNAGNGSEEKGFASLRAGGRQGNAWFRAYAMGEERDGGLLASGVDAPDYRRFGQGGFRLDWEKSALTEISLRGDLYDMKAGAFGNTANPGIGITPFTSQSRYKGYNTLLRVEHELMPKLELTAQGYFDHQEFAHRIFGERRDTTDIDLQMNTTWLPRQTLSLGLTARQAHNTTVNSDVFTIRGGPLNTYGLFINDEINLWNRQLKLIVGTRLEKNSYTAGWQGQPTARIIYTDDKWSAWAAVSRAVRLPNQTENGMVYEVNAGVGWVRRAVGDGRATSERMTSYEAGLRLFPNENLLIQANAFEYRYRGAIDILYLGATDHYIENTYWVIPVYLTNLLNGKATGGELDVSWRVNHWLELSGWINYMHQSYYPSPVSNTQSINSAYTVTRQSPKMRYHTAIGLNPTPDTDIDLNHYAWQSYRDLNVNNPRLRIHEHHRLDLRLAWRPADGVELSLVAQDLLKWKHAEDIDNVLENATYSQQAVYGSITIRH